MPQGYTEDELIEQTCIEIFQSIKYDFANCYEEKYGQHSTLGRETSSEVVITPKLTYSLIKLNPDVPIEVIDLAIDELTKDRSTLNPVIANRDVYKLIKDGVKITFTSEDESEDYIVKVIDFDNPEKNEFFLASQFWITGDLYKRRADLIGFINGLPLIFIELKAIHKNLEDAYKNNLKDYKDTIPQLFWYNTIIILSNGSQSRVGSITSDYEHFSDWKKITNEGETGVVSLDTIIKGICEKKRFIDLLENFILYQTAKGGGALVKIIAKNHQYLGVNNAIESFSKIKENEGRLGVFWHTQGSGKSFSMILFAEKVFRKIKGNYTFVVITDRIELDEQIYKNFADCGVVKEIDVHAESGAHLKQLLTEDHRYVFTLIQKFGTRTGEVYPKLSDRSDIIVITDESHRTQYDTLALNMRTALPNAAFIAFTGTPLIIGEEKTRNTFGGYVSVYNFKQSIDDGATVPLYYENRIPELQLQDKDVFNEQMNEIIERAELDGDEEKKLEREFSREYELITRNDRLDKVASDLVDHFLNRGFLGKAMVVSIDKATAVKMYEKVSAIWQKKIAELVLSVTAARDDKEKEDFELQLNYLKETELAVVVSQEQNEIEKFRNLGLDIEKHRRRMVKEEMDEKFKDPKDPFRLVFVCAMWMTGFNAPSVSTIYLDKPMRNHTLMQTIARANRVFSDKTNGLIVDYIGVFKDLKKALAIYGAGGGQTDIPVQPKEKLIGEFKKACTQINDFCIDIGIDLTEILSQVKLNTIRMIDDAVEKILASEQKKKEFLSLANYSQTLFKAILPDIRSNEFKPIVSLTQTIAKKIRSLNPPVDVSRVMEQVRILLDVSVKAEPYVIKEPVSALDLSQVDFESLKKWIDTNRKHTQVEILKNAIKAKIAALISLNKTRMNYAERFQELIDEYNSGSKNVDEFFRSLVKFSDELNEEEQRGIKEQLTEGELALFDLLKKPKLTVNEKIQVKNAAKGLLIALKSQKLVLDWRKRQQSRAGVRLEIEQFLDKNLPAIYDTNLYQEKCEIVYQHVFDNYIGQ
jgi:type I restriction enzyme R subunit